MIAALACALLGAPPLTLTLKAPPECPDYGELVRAVRRCGASPERPAVANVVVGSQPGGYVAEIALTLDGRALGRRVIQADGASCATVLQSVAVSICVALDPTFAVVEPTREGAEPSARGRRGYALPRIPLPPERPPSVDPLISARGGVTAAAQLAVGALPSPQVIPRVGGAVNGEDWTVDVDLGVSPVIEHVDGDLGIALQRVDVRLDGCWSPSLVGARAPGAVALRLCAATRVGAVVGDGRGLERGRRRSGGHAELLATLGMELRLARRLSATVDLEGGAALWRTAFFASDEHGGRELFRPALWVGGLVFALRFEVGQL